jgi:tRNA dimethylallyltransferase
MNKTLISIVGPTAIGKTKLAIHIAEHFKTEIISADSRQFFKEMTIGTAVPSEEELSAVKHHFIQHKSIMETYSVGDFERDALKQLQSLFKENDIAVMVGGSGLYIDAVAKGLDHFPKVGTDIRKKLNELYQEQGIMPLQEKLKTLDPEYHKVVDLKNPHRLIRALEICIGTHKPYSSFLDRPKTKRPFRVVTLGLYADRPLLYNRINKRVDRMMEMGLLTEATALKKYGHLNALQTVGYRELFDFLEGKWDKPTAIAEIKKNTRRFAKRQITWFKRNQETHWIPYDYQETEVLDKLDTILHENIYG